MEHVVETHELTKRYEDFTAVNHLNMEVNKGEIFGFLGPNGAGKTTTVLMLMGLSVPTSGTAIVGGYDIVEQSREIRSVASSSARRGTTCQLGKHCSTSSGIGDLFRCILHAVPENGDTTW